MHGYVINSVPKECTVLNKKKEWTVKLSTNDYYIGHLANTHDSFFFFWVSVHAHELLFLASAPRDNFCFVFERPDIANIAHDIA